MSKWEESLNFGSLGQIVHLRNSEGMMKRFVATAKQAQNCVKVEIKSGSIGSCAPPHNDTEGCKGDTMAVASRR